MNVLLPGDLPVKTSENGMNRFFSPTNPARYRGLTCGTINTAKRSQILKVLADEWSAFTRECRVHSAIRVRSAREDVVSRRECSN
jgi:hypothetical protein